MYTYVYNYTILRNIKITKMFIIFKYLRCDCETPATLVLVLAVRSGLATAAVSGDLLCLAIRQKY